MIIAIMGTNACGKTTLAKSLLGTRKSVLDNTIYKITTGNNLVSFGAYYDYKKMGGCDVESKQFTKKLEHFLETYKDQDMIVEGLLVSLKTNLHRFLKVSKDIKVIILTAEYEEILRRLYKRNGIAKNYKNVEGRIRTCFNFQQHCANLGIPYIYLDTTKKSIDEVYNESIKFIKN